MTTSRASSPLVQPTFATIKIGSYRAMLTPADFAWTGHKSPPQFLTVGDLVVVQVQEVSGITARVELEQEPAAQAALLAIDNPTGDIKALVGGYDFDESKYNRATQAFAPDGQLLQGLRLRHRPRAGRFAVRHGGG